MTPSPTRICAAKVQALPATKEAICSAQQLSTGRYVLLHGQVTGPGQLRVKVRTVDHALTGEVVKLAKWALNPASKKKTVGMPRELAEALDFDFL